MLTYRYIMLFFYSTHGDILHLLADDLPIFDLI